MKVAQTVECLVASMADQLVEKREERWAALSASPKAVQSAAALAVMMVNRTVAWRADVMAGLSERSKAGTSAAAMEQMKVASRAGSTAAAKVWPKEGTPAARLGDC